MFLMLKTARLLQGSGGGGLQTGGNSPSKKPYQNFGHRDFFNLKHLRPQIFPWYIPNKEVHIPPNLLVNKCSSNEKPMCILLPRNDEALLNIFVFSKYFIVEIFKKHTK